MLFVPANNPNMMVNAPIFQPDCIAFDLEDAISVKEKDSARDLLVEALKEFDFGGCEVFTRINALSTPFGEDDIKALVPAGLRKIRLPMCETQEDVIALDELLNKVEHEHQLPLGCVKIMASIETAKGVMNSYQIAGASDRVTAISFGAEDFTNSMGIDRSGTGMELFTARSQIALSASANGIDSFDTVYIDIDDKEGFCEEAEQAKQLGFSGKSVIHPSQVDLVHEIFAPEKEEIEHAKRVIAAIEEAEQQGLGVVSLDGKMIDAPVVEKAQRIITLAKGSKLI